MRYTHYMKQFHWVLLCICVAALIPRIFSVQWNIIDHGDIKGDVTAAYSLITHHQLRTSDELDLSLTPDFIPPGIGRSLLVSHPPVWALLGAAALIVFQREPTFDNAFFALKILSVLCGLLVVVLTAVVGRRLFDTRTSLVIAFWIASSYLMIDYSGNGALYSLQTVTYFVWIIVAYKDMKSKPCALGVASGLGYLVNHQSMVLAAASVIVLLVTDRSWKQKITDLVTVTLVTFAVASPWLIRNYRIFGDLFFSHAVNATYIYVKAAVPREIIDGREHFILGFFGHIEILRSMLMVWLPNNLYYIARKLFILAPVLFLFFSFACVDYVFSPQRRKIMLPIIALLVLHIFLSASWPVTKFRYFVPMLPLVFFVSVDQIRSLSFSPRVRDVLFGLITACILILSYMTYLSVPTHTYYYDGAITNDPFHGREEYNYLIRRGILTK